MAKLIIANWKMNGDLAKIDKDLSHYSSTAVTNKENVVLALPYLYIVAAQQKLSALSSIKLAAQNLSNYEDKGAYTGEISGTMLKDAGVTYVLIGHSERRSLFNENGAILTEKVNNAFSCGLIPVFCVGEALATREANNYLTFIGHQLGELTQVRALQDMVIAYEPCWAIGTGKVPTHDEIAEVINFIHSHMQKNFAYAKITVLYGGSVTSQNAQEILAIDGVGGVLVGGASLKVTDFAAICEYA